MKQQNPLRQLAEAGQSFWMDTISRDIIRGGTLKRLIREDGLRGVTSNPDIFEKAISGSRNYDDQISRLAKCGKGAGEIYEALAVDDIRQAADVLRGVYDATEGVDGYISLEVSPYLAFDAAGTVAEAHRLWQAVNRPNLFIKVPATPPGVKAVRILIGDGINVNVTLIFSFPCYEDVMEAYLSGLEAYFERGGKGPGPASVASFFVSRLDVLVDKLLSSRVLDAHPKGAATAQSCYGKAAVAAAKVAYQNYLSKFGAPRFDALKRRGARVQRPLWASTSTKNPLYHATMYVDPLVGRDTVNTMPLVTIDAWRESGVVRPDSILEGVDEARQVLADLESLGIDLNAATWQLQEEGVAKFNQPFDKLLGSLSAKRLAVTGFAKTQTENLHQAGKHFGAVSSSLADARVGRRLVTQDPTLWPGGPDVWNKISNRLGWVSVAQDMRGRADELKRFASHVRKDGIRHVVLLGMGGSSLCPEVCAKVFGPAKGFPELIVLDSTAPGAIAAAEKRIDLRKSLFVAASKSGSTIETNTLSQYFTQQLTEAGVAHPGRHFIAITDPGTILEELAARRKFRACFVNPPDIGGRYSALSFFGLVPMALIGMDVAAILDKAIALTRDVGLVPDLAADDPVRLGAVIGALASHGRNKLTFAMTPAIASLGDWIEQLVAESTGKDGKGILPVVGESPTAWKGDLSDRVVVAVTLGADKTAERAATAAEGRGVPVIRIKVPDRLALGAEFLRWEIATAVAGVVMELNPFDEPNVSESKSNTAAVLSQFIKTGGLPFPKPHGMIGRCPAAFTRAGAAAAGKLQLAKPAQGLKTLLKGAGAGDYAGILAFVNADPKATAVLKRIRERVAAISGRPVTLGIGPRYLHSTGQLHKGGDASGIFLVLVEEADDDIGIPGEPFSFGILAAAQALGDFKSLDTHGRRGIIVQLGSRPVVALGEVLKALGG